MQDMRSVIDQMVLYILAQVARLDQVRFQMFLKWLKSHSYQVRNAEQDPIDVEARNKEHIDDHLKNSLKIWFESLPVLGLLWEYQLILTEIRWWCSLDERSLGRILKSDDEQ
jgi:hypothetical protein